VNAARKAVVEMVKAATAAAVKKPRKKATQAADKERAERPPTALPDTLPDSLPDALPEEPAEAPAAGRPWFLYLIECADGSIYTGITTNVAARYAAHAEGKGARYTRAHPPARLLGWEAHPDRSAASKAEYRIKRLTAAAKRAYAAALPATRD
jgi:putative endonuclease